jgi:hypothetical protein
MKLEGTLATFPLRELIDMVVYSSVTGVLNIYGQGETGRLYFRGSALYHASRGEAVGAAALAELFELSDGAFSFVSDATADASSLAGPVAADVRSAERLAARWRAVRPYVPRPDLVPRLIAPRDSAWRRVSPAYHPALTAIDGSMDLRQLAASLSWAEVDVAEAVAQMCLDGVVELRTPGAVRELYDAGAEAPAPPEGVFDRILSRTPARTGDTEPRPAGTRPEELILRLLRGPS